MEEFLNSQLFRTVEAQIGQTPDGLFWFVSHGERAGIYLSSCEALSSVDNERSSRYQRAFAFRSLTHAFHALIDNEDVPLGLIYDYDPNRNPVEARNIWGTVLHSGDSESRAPDPPQNTVPSSPPVLRSSIPSPTILSTPHREHRASTLEAMAGTPPHWLGSPGFIIYSPNASFNFSQDTNASPSVGRRHTEPEPGPEVKQETKEKGKGKWEESTTPVLPGVERGRQLLRVTRWTPVDIERVEELLMLADDQVQQLVRDKAVEIRERTGKYTAQYILDDIYQTPCLSAGRKKAGPFRAYVSLEMERINKDVPEGEPRKKIFECMGEIATRWASLSPSEKAEATAGRVEELEDRKKNRATGHHNVALAAFQDTRLTFENVAQELQRLNMRTSDECLLVVEQSGSKSYAAITAAEKRVEGFNQVKVGTDECAGKNKVNRMYYKNFEHHITEQHGIIVKNWPLMKFCNPSEIHTSTEIRILINSWTSGTTFFYKMSLLEWEEWSSTHAEAVQRMQEVRDQPRDESPPTAPQPPGDDEGNTPPTDSPLNPPIDRPPAHPLPSPARTPPLTASTEPSSSGGSFVNSFAVTGANGMAIQTAGRT
ncbi:hypothetical protein HHX47_DHR4001012 [Lentinula edodes]|nr:hypothetical protein HHX47_DHR4001012 [Lentinula edodes]